MADAKSVSEQVVVGVVSAAVLGVGALLWNWASAGGLVRALGGLKLEDIKLEMIEGEAQIATIDRDGFYYAIATNRSCPPDTVLMSGSCEVILPGIANLQQAGMYRDSFVCQWNSYRQGQLPDGALPLAPQLQPMCARIVKK